MDKSTQIFISGVHNVLDAEKTPRDSAKDLKNFVYKDGRVVLVGGRQALGVEGNSGSITGLHIGYKVNGDKVYYRKKADKVEYWDGNSWEDTGITGLSSSEDISFANYTSLAGSFTFVNCSSGYWLLINANPTSPISIYDASKNFYGYILIDRGRTILWNRANDKTGLYGSYIDRQDSTTYTAVTGESIGSSGSKAYSGTLAFKSGGAKRFCFGLSITANTGAGAETFTDNFNGVLTSNFGGTGTINYSTGAYSVTFINTTTGAVTGNYSWQDPTAKGVADFTKSATRNPGEGFVFRQDEGGDAILKVEVGQDGSYYSLKENSCYRLSLDDTDTTGTNEVFRKDMGLPSWRASVASNRGIVFINTANPTSPTMTILQKNRVSLDVEPIVLFSQFDFTKYDFSDCGLNTYDRWILVFCKEKGQTSNNVILLCNIRDKNVSIVKYSGRMSIQDEDKLYIGDSISQSVYEIFSGFDDLGLPVEAYWEGKNDLLDTESLKKTRKLRVKGLISPDQSVDVYYNLDEEGYQLAGTLSGSANYVNYDEIQAIGSSLIGEGQIGGDDVINAYGYYAQIKLRTGKFRTISIKFVPTGIGYFDFNLLTYKDILVFEDRMPKSYRNKP